MDELAPIGLVGTARHAAAGAVVGEHPADAILAALRLDDRERLFLLNAGVRAVFDLCGRTPTKGISPPSPSPLETRSCASPKVVGVLQQAMDADPPDLLVEFLGHLKMIGYLLPPELLPLALATKKRGIREQLRPVLGERGRWLAQLNPEWHWATKAVAGDADADRDSLVRQWDDGNIDERCRAMETLRRSDPSEARRWIEEAIGKEKAESRVRLLETLAMGLGPQDETLLESLLDDRSEQVRRAAAACLARIPGSALARRMADRACSILSAQKKGLLRKSPRLVCNPPEEIDAAWVRDGVPAKVPTGQGKRAVWTEAVLAAVSPTLWCEQFGLQPAELMQAIAKDDFAEAVIVGWTRAAVVFAEPDTPCAAWLLPLAAHWLAATSTKKAMHADVLGHLQALLPRMSAAEAESLLLRVLREASAVQGADALVLLEALPRPWSTTFALEYLAAERSILQRPVSPFSYRWAETLKLAGYTIPREAFAAALEPWHLPDTDPNDYATQAIARATNAFTETIQARRRFYDDVREESASGSVPSNS